MPRVAVALAGACLLVTPYAVLAAQRAGSTVQNPSAARQLAPIIFPRSIRLAAQEAGGGRHGCWEAR